jgi:spore maturation protein CgeB
MKLNIVVFGLAITSSWGNGHAVTYRSLIKALHERGHTVTFLERDTPWYREHRDLDAPDYCRVELYQDLKDVPKRFGELVAQADLVILGSYVAEGIRLADWITSLANGTTAFYDIDTPVTLAGLSLGKTEYISAALIPRFDLYLSFTGGPVLDVLEDLYGSQRARALYCTADVETPTALDLPAQWTLGYLGTYSADRQPALECLLLKPAKQMPRNSFVVAGSQYPAAVSWPPNVARIEHLPPSQHRSFYQDQRYTLNITRADMIAAGFSPSVRLFEAAARGVPIISDFWPGLDTFFEFGREILVARSTADLMRLLNELPEERRRGIAAAARKRFLKSHTPHQRAKQLEEYYLEVVEAKSSSMKVKAIA